MYRLACSFPAAFACARSRRCSGLLGTWLSFTRSRYKDIIYSEIKPGNVGRDLYMDEFVSSTLG